MQLNVKSRILTEKEIARTINRMALQMLEENGGIENLVLVGIKTRGIYLAERIAKAIHSVEDKTVPTVSLDIALYRDDLSEIAKQPMVKTTNLPIDVTGKKVILVDDVLYTGRTIRAALDALFDLGRPDIVHLAVLIDRGHKQLPITANFTGKFIATRNDEIIKVNLNESDDLDEVWIATRS